MVRFSLIVLSSFLKFAAVSTPKNLYNTGGGIIPLHYKLIDPIFSTNISAAAIQNDDRYPIYNLFPWDSFAFVIASFQQITVDDTVNSLKWANHAKYPKYNKYDVAQELVYPIDKTRTCLNGTLEPCQMDFTLQVSTTTLISIVQQSHSKLDRPSTFLEEGAILGAFSFIASFLTMYMV
jgi:hypothetical protein